MRNIILSTLFLFFTFSVSSAQAPKVKFYPFGDPILCKGCGHGGSDYWRLKFKLENVSGEDLTVYGRKLGVEWDFINDGQDRNPHLCEWEYGYAEKERRVSWKDMSDSDKVPVTLKAGEYIVSERGIDNYVWQPVTRFTAFVSRIGEPEPVEVFSEAFVGVKNGDPTGTGPSFRMVDDTCSPQCTIGIDRSPEINGIRLGMSLAEFRERFPKEKVHRLHKDVVNFKSAGVWEWDRDSYMVWVRFLDDKVASIEASIRSLDGKRYDPKFFELVASKINFPYWLIYRSGWECKEFIVDVLTNEQPTITVRTREFIKVQSMLAERDIKKRK